MSKAAVLLGPWFIYQESDPVLVWGVEGLVLHFGGSGVPSFLGLTLMVSKAVIQQVVVVVCRQPC